MASSEVVSSIGIITVVDEANATFRLKEDEGLFCALCCTGATEVVSDGCAIPLTDLSPGDVVRWEGTRAEEGQAHASKVVLLQPAWMTISSPEW